MLNKGELVQSFWSQMLFLSPSSRSHSLDLVLSLTTETLKQGKGHQFLISFTSPLQSQNLKFMLCLPCY